MKIEDNLSIEQYHNHTRGVSKSDLDLIARSPAHYVAAKALGRKETPAMAIGSAFHAMTLEPETFDQEFAVLPEGLDRRTKAGKEAFARFEMESVGKRIIGANDLAVVRAMANSVHSHPLAGPLVTGGRAEQSIFWESSIVEGVTSKCRPDYIKNLKDERYVIVDLKSTEDARPFAFERSAWSFRYHVQAAYYWDGCTDGFGHAPDAFIFVVVEKAPPYAVAVYEASIDDMMNAGRDEYYANLKTFRQCELSGEWPAYPVEIQKLLLPKWAA